MTSTSDALSAAMSELEQARALREAAQYEQALGCYRRLVEQAPPDFPYLPAVQAEIGLVLGFMGEFDDSLAVLHESADQWPASALVHLSLGKTLLMLGQYEAARAPLEKAVGLSPPDDGLHQEAAKQLALLAQYGY